MREYRIVHVVNGTPTEVEKYHNNRSRFPSSDPVPEYWLVQVKEYCGWYTRMVQRVLNWVFGVDAEIGPDYVWRSDLACGSVYEARARINKSIEKDRHRAKIAQERATMPATPIKSVVFETNADDNA